MRELKTHGNCPACNTRMVPRVVACPACKLRIEGDFIENEFARLEEDWLHFLRIFIHCEGRITDMEAALGISYPTVKSRIAELKKRLGEHVAAEISGTQVDSVSVVLSAFEAGEIDYDEAMRLLERK